MKHLTEEERQRGNRYDRLYKKFIDKVGDRRKIPYDEYTKITMEIYEENPEFGDCVFSAAIWSNGWRAEDYMTENEEIETYMMKSN